MKRTRFTGAERAWVLYDVGNSAYVLAVTTAIFPLFFKNVVAADLPGATSTAWLAYASSVFTLVVAVLALVLGPLADYEGRKKRFFSVFFGLGVVATGVLAFATEGQALVALAVYVLSSIGFAGANVFYDSFLTDVTPPERMDRLSSAGYAWGYVGSTVPFIVAMAVVMAGPRFDLLSTVTAVRIAFLIAAAWWVVFTVPLLRRVRQTQFIPPVESAVRDSLRRLGALVRERHRYRTVFVFLIAYFFYIDGVGTVIKLATAYGTDIGLSANTLLVVLLVVQFVAFPCALIYSRLARARRSSVRTMLLVGIGVYLLVTLLAFVIPRLPAGLQVPMFWVTSMLVASSQGGIQALSRSYYGQLIPATASAEFFGFYNMFGKFAAILGPLLVGVFAQLTGDSSIGGAQHCPAVPGRRPDPGARAAATGTGDGSGRLRAGRHVGAATGPLAGKVALGREHRANGRLVTVAGVVEAPHAAADDAEYPADAGILERPHDALGGGYFRRQQLSRGCHVPAILHRRPRRALRAARHRYGPACGSASRIRAPTYERQTTDRDPPADAGAGVPGPARRRGRVDQYHTRRA